MSFYLLITFISGLLLGVRAGLLSAGMGILIGAFMLLAEAAGRIEFSALQLPVGAAFAYHAAELIFGAALIYIYLRQLRENSEALIASEIRYKNILRRHKSRSSSKIIRW